jgi:hypothetical protein
MIDAPNDSIEVDNPAEVLRCEDGRFEVTSPYGHVFQVTCRRGQKMDHHGVSDPPQVDIPDGMLWRIRRLA